MSNPSFLSRQVTRGSYYLLDLRAKADAQRTVVLCGGLEECAVGYRVERPNGFFCHGIEFVVSGRGRYETGKRSYPLGAGSLFHYAPGVPHRILSSGDAPLVKYFVDFVGDPALRMLQKGVLARQGPIVLAHFARINQLFEELQAGGAPKTSSSAAICARFLEILLLSIQEMRHRHTDEDVRASRDTYTRYRNYIQDHCRSLHSLDDIARHCHADASSLCRLFRKHGDRSPYQLLIMLKMRRAAELIANGGMLVKEVARDVGYDDPYLFSKVFKRIHGVSPRKFLSDSQPRYRRNRPPIRAV